MIRELTRRRGLLLAAAIVAAFSLGGVHLFARRGAPAEPPPPRRGYQQLYEAGVARLRAGRYLEAIPLLERATRIDPVAALRNA